MFTEGKEDKKKDNMGVCPSVDNIWRDNMDMDNIFILSASDKLSTFRVDDGLFGLPKVCVCII